MKFIIIGLGNFGASIAIQLTDMGHEVVAVDITMNKVDALKESVSHAICLDSTDPQAVTHLPVKDADVVMICIGENEGANILSTALMKKLKAKRLISRAVSRLHETVLEAMGIEEIVHPEEETAERWVKKLNMKGIVDSFELPEGYNIIEAKAPSLFVGKAVHEIGFRRNFNVVLLTTIRSLEERNLIGIKRPVKRVTGIATSKTLIEENDILVLYGYYEDIKRLLSQT
jgi:trk system potassium uptake protein